MLGRYLSAFSGSLALHAGLFALILWRLFGGLPVAAGDGRPPRAMTAFVVPQEDARFPGLNPLDPAATSEIRPLKQGSESISVGGFRFDAAKLFARAPVLFPFLSPGISLAHFAVNPQETSTLIYRRPASAAALRQRAATTKPLELSDDGIQSVVDKTWSRRERWTAFDAIRQLADRYSAETGALPVVFQRYTDQNALQPYQDMSIPDPRLWTQLGLAADHVSFIGFIREYSAAHPGTRGAIDLLFLLDRIAEASQDALETLLECNPEKDLHWTRESNRDAYRLALQLRTHYRAVLSRLDINSPAAVDRYYAGVRLNILRAILRSTPDSYRASDAQFLIGSSHWRLGQRADALAAWRQTRVVQGDSYVVAAAQLAMVLRLDSTERSTGDLIRQITRVLKNESGRWADFSYDRLKRFGYRFDTY